MCPAKQRIVRFETGSSCVGLRALQGPILPARAPPRRALMNPNLSSGSIPQHLPPFHAPPRCQLQTHSLSISPDRVLAPLLLHGVWRLVGDFWFRIAVAQLPRCSLDQTVLARPGSGAVQRCTEPDTILLSSPRRPTPSTGQVSGWEWRRGAGSRRDDE